MADDGKGHGDDESMDDGFDAWAELEADATPDLGEGISFSLDDAPAEAILDPDLDASLEAGPEAEPLADDAVIDAWLQEPATDPEAMPLSVFVPDDPSDSIEPSSGGEATEWPHEPAIVEVDPGQSGVASASDIDVLGLLEADQPAVGGDAVFESAAADDAHPEPVETVAFAAADHDGGDAEADIIDFGTAAAGVATIAAAAAAGDAVVADPAAAAGPVARRKRGLVGQLLGVVLGGLLAIPLVLGLLIGSMWMGWKDMAGIRGWMPPQLAFLLPAAPQAVAAISPAAPSLAASPSLDDLPAAAVDAETSVDAEPTMTPGPDATEPAPPMVADESIDPAPTALPAVAAAGLESAPPETSVPIDAGVAEGTAAAPPAAVADAVAVDPPASMPAAPAATELATIVPPSAPAVMDEPVAQPAVPDSVPAPAVEPEPLDLGGLEAAVAAAAAALDEVKAVADPADPVRKVRLVNWYRQLARVAQELATIEHVAAESGRPLPATPAPAADLGGRLLAAPELTGDLARLARNWLSYSRREADGVVMPATFAGTRRVGPYWCSRVAIADAGGAARELAVISRVEPSALPGDAVIVMGLVMDGGVLWASDFRSATAAAAPAGEPDPFAQPGL